MIEWQGVIYWYPLVPEPLCVVPLASVSFPSACLLPAPDDDEDSELDCFSDEGAERSYNGPWVLVPSDDDEFASDSLEVLFEVSPLPVCEFAGPGSGSPPRDTLTTAPCSRARLYGQT
jgi:hypothetical protein